MLTVTRLSPASFSGCARPSSRCPFVVKRNIQRQTSASAIYRRLHPGRKLVRIRASSPTISTRPRPQQRLATRQPNLLHAKVDKHAHHAQVILNPQLRILRTFSCPSGSTHTGSCTGR